MSGVGPIKAVGPIGPVPAAPAAPVASTYPSAMPGGQPAVGKGSKQQDLISPHSGVMSTLAAGEPLSRMMNHYGKGKSMAAPTGIRGAGGGLNKGHVRQGGLGPGRMSAPGSSADYSMTNADPE
jgi:hypothetical protein